MSDGFEVRTMIEGLSSSMGGLIMVNFIGENWSAKEVERQPVR
jgi:hypothetical protein